MYRGKNKTPSNNALTLTGQGQGHVNQRSTNTLLCPHPLTKAHCHRVRRHRDCGTLSDRSSK